MENVSDFRTKRYITHHLSDILISALFAVLSGADDFEEIAEYGREKEEFLKMFLDLPHGIPSHEGFSYKNEMLLKQ